MNNEFTEQIKAVQGTTYSIITQSLNVEYQYTPDFRKIVIDLFDAVGNGNLDYAHETSKALLQAGCSDLRVCIVYIYSSDLWLTEFGLQELIAILDSWVTEKPTELVGPKLNELFADFFDRHVYWLFKKMLQKIKRMIEKQQEQWRQFLLLFNQESWLMNVNLIRYFALKLDLLLQESQCNAFKVVNELSGVLSAVEINTQPDQCIDHELEQQDENELIPEQEVKIDNGVSNAKEHNIGSSSLSYHLIELQQKLAFFQDLLADSELTKASIVASDIEEILANFDPKLYFPELFKPFVQCRAQFITEFQQAEMLLQSHDSKALFDLYQVDRNAFKALSLDDEVPQYSHGQKPMWED